jgi:hypothetical protein
MLYFNFIGPILRRGEAKLGSKWVGFEIPSSEEGGSTLLTWRFLRPDSVGTHTLQTVHTAECCAAEILILLVVV